MRLTTGYAHRYKRKSPSYREQETSMQAGYITPHRRIVVNAPQSIVKLRLAGLYDDDQI